MSLAQAVEWFAWLSVLVNLWWFHRRLSKLEGKRNFQVRRIEVVTDDPDKFAMRMAKRGPS